MNRVVEAIYSHGVLEPLERLDLPEKQRVRLIVQPIDGQTGAPAEAATQVAAFADREQQAALNELFAEIDRMNLQLSVRLPTRDELHERR